MIWAIIKTRTEGYHWWADAPKEVSFLRDKHRHIFFIELWIEQNHNERDVEYIIEKRKLDKFLSSHKIKSGDPMSCEALATEIKAHWEYSTSGRKIKVGVWEDNENGAFIE